MARPTKRTPETDKRIMDALKVGATRKDAALAAGISEDTFSRWMSSFADFAGCVKKAEAEDSVRSIAIITKAAQDNWQAAAWKLERRDPRNWGRRDRLALGQDPDTAPVRIEVEFVEQPHNPGTAPEPA